MLLQGLILCGRCGEWMTVRYHSREGRLWPEYKCQRDGIEHAKPVGQRIPGAGIDRAIGDLLVDAVSPMALDVALTVQQELQCRIEEGDRLRQKQVERAQYEVDLVRRRYMRVDPDNRLGADSLKAEWNSKLRTLLARRSKNVSANASNIERSLSEPKRAAILALSTNFPALWRDPNTPERERKRMIHLLLEDITLLRGEKITLHIRFKGGAAKTLTLPTPVNSWQQRQPSPDVVKQIDRLLDRHTYPQIAAILNERGVSSGERKAFTSRIVARLRRSYALVPRYDRLGIAGMLTVEEMAAVLGISPQRVKIWNRHGLIRGHAYNDKNDCLYEHPGENPPRKAQGIKLSQRRLATRVVPQRIEELQCEGKLRKIRRTITFTTGFHDGFR